MKDKKTKLAKAVKTLCKELKKDPDLYFSYQSSIAVAFQDTYRRKLRDNNYDYLNSNDIHKISNEAAVEFLDLLIR